MSLVCNRQFKINENLSSSSFRKPQLAGDTATGVYVFFYIIFDSVYSFGSDIAYMLKPRPV